MAIGDPVTVPSAASGSRFFPAGPLEFAGVRNFGWVLAGKLARGEQPPLEAATFAALRDAGIGSVLTLRHDAEEPKSITGREVPAYSAGEERRLAQAAGLRFDQLACTDLQAPTPDETAAGLRIMDRDTSAGHAVLVHCLAGVGRTSVITGAWLLSQGIAPEEVVRVHSAFLAEMAARRQATETQSEDNYLKQASRGMTWWALQTIAGALGLTLTPPPGLEQPAPEGCENWPAWYGRALAPWKENLHSEGPR